MTNVMSKFLNLDMPLGRSCATLNDKSRTEIHHEEFGIFSVGADADIALLGLKKATSVCGLASRELMGSQSCCAK